MKAHKYAHSSAGPVPRVHPPLAPKAPKGMPFAYFKRLQQKSPRRDRRVAPPATAHAPRRVTLAEVMIQSYWAIGRLSAAPQKQSKTYTPNGKRECARRRGDPKPTVAEVWSPAVSARVLPPLSASDQREASSDSAPPVLSEAFA